MDIKHKPSTPLPWTQGYAGGYGKVGVMGDDAIVATTYQVGDDNDRITLAEENAAYLVHAANAYPRLVEALKHAIENGGCEAEGWGKLESLLSELGEAHD